MSRLRARLSTSGVRRNRLASAVLALALVIASAAAASAMVIRAGNIILTADGAFTPTTLPRHEDAPIMIHGSGKVSTVSGELPPIVQTLIIEYDKHGSLQTAGLPICTAGKLQATTVPAARAACPGAIVGKGEGSAIIAFPESKPIHVSSPITIFNGPRVHGNATVLAHFYTTVPVATTFIVPVVIEKIRRGVYGYRTIANIPKIAGGAGHPISGSLKIGRKWSYKGVHHSYLNARCETGHLQARVQVTLSDETSLNGTFLRACKAKG
jgi:hypothetical protein